MPYTYQECLEILWGRGHELDGKKFGLEPVQAILGSLGHPERRYPSVIVAGTNGKGSTCAMLASILEHAGYRTGLYTSPHLVHVNERIKVGGKVISDEDFVESFGLVHRQAESLVSSGALPGPPSFFEYLTATAFLHFARARVEFAVLEVGMGGRLDATNVTDASVALITNVDLDHQEFLGRTLAAIAQEKAGVIKPGRVVVSGCEHPEVCEVVRRKSSEAGVSLIETGGLHGVSSLLPLSGRYSFDWQMDGCHLSEVSLQAPGEFQVKNAVMAAAAAWQLALQGFRISSASIRQGLQAASWPGRLELILNRPVVLLDGAHNPAAARELARFLRRHLAERTLRLVYGTMRDKDIGEITEILFPLAERVFLTRPDIERAATPEMVLAASRVDPQRVVVEPDPAAALERALDSSLPEDVVLAAGSLFLVGAIKKAILEGRLAMGNPAPPEVFSEYC